MASAMTIRDCPVNMNSLQIVIPEVLLIGNPEVLNCCFFVLDMVSSHRPASVDLRAGAGGSPAATHLFCFAKKGKRKKATEASRPFGVPVCAVKKMGRSETRCAQTSALLIPFSGLHKRLRCNRNGECQEQPQSQKQRHYNLTSYCIE